MTGDYELNYYFSYMKPDSSTVPSKSTVRTRRRSDAAQPPAATPRVYSALVAEVSATQTETISASVPAALVRRVRARIQKREFSQFVTRSLERELVRLNRLQLIDEIVAKSGELDPTELAAARRLIRGS